MHDPGVLDHQHPVAAPGQVEVVGDEHQLLLQAQQQVADAPRVGQVEQGGRLVGDQHVGVGGQHPGQGQELALPAGFSGEGEMRVRVWDDDVTKDDDAIGSAVMKFTLCAVGGENKFEKAMLKGRARAP